MDPANTTGYEPLYHLSTARMAYIIEPKASLGHSTKFLSENCWREPGPLKTAWKDPNISTVL